MFDIGQEPSSACALTPIAALKRAMISIELVNHFRMLDKLYLAVSLPVKVLPDAVNILGTRSMTNPVITASLSSHRFYTFSRNDGYHNECCDRISPPPSCPVYEISQTLVIPVLKRDAVTCSRMPPALEYDSNLMSTFRVVQ